MRQSKGTLMTDIALLALLALSFAGIVFIAIDSEYIVANSLALTATALVLVITYFTSLGVGLLVDAIALLVFLAYNLFTYLPTGQTPPIGIYFWLAWMPIMTVAMSFFTRGTKALMVENRDLITKLDRYVTIDDITGLRNLRAFDGDAATYMRFIKRTGAALTVVVWTLEYQERVERLYIGEAFPKFIAGAADALQKTVLEPNMLYLVDDRPYTWCYFMFAESGDSQIDSVALLAQKAREALRQYSSDLTLTMRAYAYPRDDVSPFGLLDRVKASPVVASGNTTVS